MTNLAETILRDVPRYNAASIMMTLDGLTVSVRIDAQLSMEPETMTVTPPEGFIAYPPEVTVPEGGAGTILILLEAVS